ncbi:UNVERIFIED_CONTAM: hypothetical protein Sradi_3826100 [Sesamum radiatum]|uniref:Uncharacterized protein n=1 Tax=Sesamum radiatum TaxID=300843 RepID=A0AAW2Q139_SESRA
MRNVKVTDISPEVEIPLIDEFYSMLTCTPFRVLDKGVQDRLTTKVAIEEGLEIEVAAPSEPLITKGSDLVPSDDVAVLTAKVSADPSPDPSASVVVPSEPTHEEVGAAENGVENVE